MASFFLRQKDELAYFVIDSFSCFGFVTHAFTIRHGGVSEGQYASLNMSLHVGDQPGRVFKNRKIVCTALGVKVDDLVTAEQVHGDSVAVVTAKERGKGSKNAGEALKATDAMITKEPGLLLATCHADCVPVFLFDPVQKAVGLAHAGWKGSALQIAKKTVQEMEINFASRPEDCQAGIGPSIGVCCYKVGDSVFRYFQNFFPGGAYLFTPASKGHWWLDLQEANRRSLLAAGLKERNITLAGLCTSCRNDLFFSHRADGGKTGRMMAMIMLRQRNS